MRQVRRGLGQDSGLREMEFADQGSCKVRQARSMRRLAWGEKAGVCWCRVGPERDRVAWEIVSGELFRHSPVGIVALKDDVAVAVEAEGNAVGEGHGVQSAKIAQRIFGFELEVRGQDSGRWHRPESRPE